MRKPPPDRVIITIYRISGSAARGKSLQSVRFAGSEICVLFIIGKMDMKGKTRAY